MILCSVKCIPCCDFCVYAEHEMIEEYNTVIKGGPCGCKKHLDKKHQDMAAGCGACQDFHCFNVK